MFKNHASLGYQVITCATFEHFIHSQMAGSGGDHHASHPPSREEHALVLYFLRHSWARMRGVFCTFFSAPLGQNQHNSDSCSMPGCSHSSSDASSSSCSHCRENGQLASHPLFQTIFAGSEVAVPMPDLPADDGRNKCIYIYSYRRFYFQFFFEIDRPDGRDHPRRLHRLYSACSGPAASIKAWAEPA